MKLHFQRLVAFLVVLILSISLLIVPTQAAETSQRGGFQDWANARGGGFGYEDEVYTQFIQDLNSVYGSVVFDSKGGYWIHGYLLENYTAKSLKVDNFIYRRVEFDKHVCHIRCNLSSFNFNSGPYLIFPLRIDVSSLPAGILFSRYDNMAFDYSVSISSKNVIQSAYISGITVITGGLSESIPSTGVVVSDGAVFGDSSSFLIYLEDSFERNPFLFDFTVDLHRLLYFVPNVAPSDVINNTNSRPGSLCGDVIHVGDDGSQMVADEIFIVNEGDKTLYNPVTGDTWDIESWTYDYSTRSYEVVTTTGNTVTVTYGDENITINEGGNTINIYYGIPSSGGGDPDTPSNPDNPGGSENPDKPTNPDADNWWSKLLEAIGSFLGNTVGAFFKLIGSLLISLLESLTNVIVGVITSLSNLVTLFGSFGEALSTLWTWLPDEVITIMVAAVSVVVFGALIRLFLK